MLSSVGVERWCRSATPEDSRKNSEWMCTCQPFSPKVTSTTRSQPAIPKRSLSRCHDEPAVTFPHAFERADHRSSSRCPDQCRMVSVPKATSPPDAFQTSTAAPISSCRRAMILALHTPQAHTLPQVAKPANPPTPPDSRTATDPPGVIATRPQSRHLRSLDSAQLTSRPKYRRFRRSDRLSALLLEELFAMFSRAGPRALPSVL